MSDGAIRVAIEETLRTIERRVKLYRRLVVVVVVTLILGGRARSSHGVAR
jgi:hypothetical protein